jgi:hypothetical protein
VSVETERPLQPMPADSPAPGPEAQSPAPEAQPAAAPASTPQPEQAKSDWFREAFQRTRVTTGAQPEEQPAPKPETPPASAASKSESEKPEPKQAAKDATPKPTDEPRAYSQAEIDRMVQAETDRRLSKFQREEGERRRQAALLADKERLTGLREKDPYAYAQEMKRREDENASLQAQLQQTHRALNSTVEEYDRSVLDTVFAPIPQNMHAQLLDGIEDGIPGRKTATVRALKVLEQHWKGQGFNEAKKRLSSDPAFIKEILTRYGAARQEPESVPATSATVGAGFDMNAAMRRQTGRI